MQAGQTAEAVAEVAELAKSATWDAGQWYNFACVYAVASGQDAAKRDEYAARAVELLGRAVQAGYKNTAHMAKKADLDPLRGRADFRKLVPSWRRSFRGRRNWPRCRGGRSASPVGRSRARQEAGGQALQEPDA